MPEPGEAPAVDEAPQAPSLERLLHVLEAARALLSDPHVILGSPEAAEAWEELKKAVERHDRAEQHIAITARPCEYCKTPIFFAKMPNGRFIPLETETLPASDMVGHYRYCVSFDADPPAVIVRPNFEGDVYVNHILTCGGGEGPKHKTRSLMRRWKANQLRGAGVGEELRDSLLAMRQALQHSGLDAEGD